MSLIIDGYNLLHASGILARGVGPGVLERARTALLNFLAESLTAEELPRTTVVFDATQAPKGLERSMRHRGIDVRFALPGGEADDLIEQLIKADTSPRKLIVVSSDHRLHRAAKRRKATPIDSDRWYSEIIKRRLSAGQSQVEERPRVEGPLSEQETAYWLQAFGAQIEEQQGSVAHPNPFPPGYGETVHEDD
jgi:predicted RNA-binding protein with PIN domain